MEYRVVIIIVHFVCHMALARRSTQDQMAVFTVYCLRMTPVNTMRNTLTYILICVVRWSGKSERRR